MLKGASRAVLKILERELHEAWRTGREEGRRDVVGTAVPEILAVRFGREVRAAAASVAKFPSEDELVKLVVLAAIAPDFGTFYRIALSPEPEPRRRRRGPDRDRPSRPASG